MSHHEDDKKKKIRERNRRMWQIFTQAEEMRAKVDVGAAVVEREGKPKATTRQAEEAVNMHLVAIRNRIDGGRRKSEDRWNRFAGTSGGGGKGR